MIMNRLYSILQTAFRVSVPVSIIVFNLIPFGDAVRPIFIKVAMFFLFVFGLAFAFWPSKFLDSVLDKKIKEETLYCGRTPQQIRTDILINYPLLLILLTFLGFAVVSGAAPDTK